MMDFSFSNIYLNIERWLERFDPDTLRDRAVRQLRKYGKAERIWWEPETEPRRSGHKLSNSRPNLKHIEGRRLDVFRILSVDAAVAEYESLTANPLVSWPKDWIPVFEFEEEWYFIG